jgi:hypothetical protein
MKLPYCHAGAVYLLDHYFKGLDVAKDQALLIPLEKCGEQTKCEFILRNQETYCQTNAIATDSIFRFWQLDCKTFLFIIGSLIVKVKDFQYMFYVSLCVLVLFQLDLWRGPA